MANYCNIDQYLYNYLKSCWVDKSVYHIFCICKLGIFLK